MATKILIIGIHIDDCECMGGTINLLVKKGADVTILNVKQYMHHKGHIPEADAQSLRCAEILGAKKIILDYSGTRYYKTNEDTVRKTEEVIKEIKPDIIFFMHPKDNHIEHAECAITAREAIFAAAVDGVIANEIYTFETGPLQTMCYFQPDFHINVAEAHEKKLEALGIFNQKNANGDRLRLELTRCANFRAQQCGLDFAESFMIMKYPNGNNPFYLYELLKDEWRWAGHKMYYRGSEWFL